MSKTIQGNPTPAIAPSQTKQSQERADSSLKAKLDATGAPPIEPRGLQQTDGVNELLGRAGLQQGVDGSQTIKDTATVSKGAEGLTASEQLYGTTETQIKPPAPPRIELTNDLKVGAETFAANIDELTNSVLFKNGAVPSDTKPVINESTTPFETINYLFYGNKLSGSQVRAEAEAALAESQTGLPQSKSIEKSSEAKSSSGFTSDSQGQVTVPVQLPTTQPGQQIVFDPATGQPMVDPNMTYAQVFSPENIKAVFQAVAERGELRQTTPVSIGGVDAGNVRSWGKMSADMLLALFLKLNINDPNNSVETHNALHELSTNLRQQGIQEAQDRAKTATAMMKEAEAYAQKVGVLSKVVMIITIIIAIVLAVFTFGAGLAIIGPAIAGIQGATLTVIKIVMALLVLIMQLMVAGANHKAATKTADASEAKNDVERARLEAEKEQRVIEEEAAIMKVIMESKNQTVEAVIRMLNAMFATQTKVMSAGMTR